MIHWFGYFKKQNEITFSSVDFNLVVPFLRGRDFCIEKLSTLKENKIKLKKRIRMEMSLLSLTSNAGMKAISLTTSTEA